MAALTFRTVDVKSKNKHWKVRYQYGIDKYNTKKSQRRYSQHGFCKML